MRYSTATAGVPVVLATLMMVSSTSYTTLSVGPDITSGIYTAMNVQDMESPDVAPEPEPEAEGDAVPVNRRLQLALAQVCVHESGFQVRTLDCRMMYEVLRDRSRTGRLTMGIMRAYSTRTFDTNRTDRRRWIPHLNHWGREPRHWRETTTIPWSMRRPAWMRVYRYAGALLSRPQPRTCSIPVHHWGAQGFRREMHYRQGWIRINNCGPTLNEFWNVPTRLSPSERTCRHVDPSIGSSI